MAPNSHHTVSSLTSISPKGLVIKRKYKYVNSGSQSTQRWWFVVRSDEAVLRELEIVPGIPLHCRHAGN